MNSRSSLVNELKDRDYRRAYVRSQIRIGLPLQCRALRENRNWTQPELAEHAGMSQPRISEIERPGERSLNLETLLRLADAYDIALQVRFVPFREFVDWADNIRLDDYSVTPFDEDLGYIENEEMRERGREFLEAHCREFSPSSGSSSSDIGESRALAASDDPLQLFQVNNEVRGWSSEIWK